WCRRVAGGEHFVAAHLRSAICSTNSNQHGGHRMKNLSRLTFVALALALLLIPNFGMAQTSRTTGALIGIVTDGQGNPLPGVTVTVTSPQLQGARTAVTDAKGEYILPTLPPGA